MYTLHADRCARYGVLPCSLLLVESLHFLFAQSCMFSDTFFFFFFSFCYCRCCCCCSFAQQCLTFSKALFLQFPLRRTPTPPRIPKGFIQVNVTPLAEPSQAPSHYYPKKSYRLPKRRIGEMRLSRFVPTFPQGLRFLRFLLALITAGILGTAYKNDDNWDSSIKHAGGLLIFTVYIHNIPPLPPPPLPTPPPHGCICNIY